MVTVYECWSVMDENGNSTKDYTCEFWGASTKHPDSKYYYSDWGDKSTYLEDKYQIYQWLLYLASRTAWPFHAREIVDYANEHWYNW